MIDTSENDYMELGFQHKTDKQKRKAKKHLQESRKNLKMKKNDLKSLLAQRLLE